MRIALFLLFTLSSIANAQWNYYQPATPSQPIQQIPYGGYQPIQYQPVTPYQPAQLPQPVQAPVHCMRLANGGFSCR